MNRRCSIRAASLLLAVALAVPAAMQCQAGKPQPQPHPQAAPAPTRLHAGPVYTSASGDTEPAFPRLQIVLTTDALQQTMPQPSDLTLLEDGVEGPQATEVTTFDKSGYGIAAAVLIDVSGSMSGRPLQIIRESLYRFASDARSQDRVEVLTVADDTHVEVPFGSDKATLTARLQQMHSRGTKTRLYDGVIDALETFQTSLPARRELTIISDGHDEGSVHKLQDVIREAQTRGIAIDSIGLTRTSPLWLPYLNTLSVTTGGTFHQVHSDQELQTLISNGMVRLKASPLATFEAQHLSGDGEVHRIGVRWRSTPTLTGDTTFTAPSATGWNGLRAKLTNLPGWAYPLAAFAVLLLIVGLIALFRSLSRPKRVIAPAPAPVPVQTAPPPPPAPAPRNRTPTIADVSSSATQYESRPQPPAPRPVTTEAAPPPPPPPPAAKKKTRLVGFFDGNGSVIATIEGLGGSLAGRRIDVSKNEFWLGAAADNDLVIENDPTVSSRHACLIFQDRLLMIADNHSTNGIRVNGEVLRGSRRPVQPGDQIQIGRSLCVIRSAE